MIHPLCKKCTHTCKQETIVKIIHCPKFQKRLSDTEFKGLVDELDTMETEAGELRKRARRLIQKALAEEKYPAENDE